MRSEKYRNNHTTDRKYMYKLITNSAKEFHWDHDSIKSLSNLHKESKHKKITLVTGSGVSASVGVPVWSELLENITDVFIKHWDDLTRTDKRYLETPPSNLSLIFPDGYPDGFPFDHTYYNQYVDHLIENNDPLVIAQLIKNCLTEKDWKWMLRRNMYKKFPNSGNDDLIQSDLFHALAQIVKLRHHKIKNVLTYNYDDLLELYFNEIGIRTKAIVRENSDVQFSNFPVYYLHGMLPFKGGLDGKIFLTEDDYLSDIIEPNSWYNQLHASVFTNNICIFLGLSFNDPSLKRKLAINRLFPNHYHYALLTHKDDKFEKSKFLLLRKELLRLNVRVIKYPYSSNHDYLPKTIDLIKSII